MSALSGNAVAASSKARFRRSTLLTGADYSRLLEQETVAGVATCLAATPYRSMLQGVDLEEVRRSELEFDLSMAVFKEATGFRPYLRPTSRKFLELWLENFDITLFKICFRSHFGGRLGAYARNEANESREVRMLDLVSEFKLTLVNQEKLFGAQTLRDLVGAVIGERLRDALAEVLPQKDESVDLSSGDEFQKLAFAFGMTLDRYYYNTLFTVARCLTGAEGRLMRMLVGTRVDLLNLYWIYRARRFFDMSPEQALTLITRVRYRLDFELLTKAAFASPGSWPELLARTPYGEVFVSDDAGEELREVQIERNLHRVLAHTVSTIFMSGMMGFHNIAAYLTLKEFEVRDLIAVIEAVRYGFDRKKMGSLLIRPLGGEEDRGMGER